MVLVGVLGAGLWATAMQQAGIKAKRQIAKRVMRTPNSMIALGRRMAGNGAAEWT
jgi:hypothetical protein